MGTERYFAASESTFGTAVNLAASQALRMVSVAMGKSSQTGNVRPVKDRPSGRGMVSEYLEGDVEPFDFALEYSQRWRSAVDAAAFDLAILKAAGLRQTINGSTSTVISLVPTPIENDEFASLQLARFLGSGSALAQAEVLQGCVVKSPVWSGGGQEVMVKASARGHQQGARRPHRLHHLRFKRYHLGDALGARRRQAVARYGDAVRVSKPSPFRRWTTLPA